MSLFGTLREVASIGGQLLTTLFPQRSNQRWFIEFESGKKVTILGKYILHHPDPRMVGSVSSGFSVPEDEEVSIIVCDQEGGKQIYAYNNDPNKNYTLSFSKTNGNGESSIPVIPLPAAMQPGVENYENITTEFRDFIDGAMVVTPLEQGTSPVTRTRFGKNGSKKLADPVDGYTVLANFSIATVIAAASYVLYANADNQTISYSWIEENNRIVGCRITSTLPHNANVTVNLNWISPAFGLSIDIPLGGAANLTAEPVDTYFEPFERPINSTAITVSSPDASPEFRAKVMQSYMTQLKSKGKLETVKRF